MKIPLSYQATEYDCGPTTMLNGMSYLFKREEIPPDIVKYISLYCLDSYNNQGEFGKKGTSTLAMMFLSNWLNQFGKAKDFPIESEFLSGADVSLKGEGKLVYGLQRGGAVVVRLMYGCWHYVLLTGITGNAIDLFDPYYRKRPFSIEGIELLTDDPFKKNRRVQIAHLDSTGKNPYAFGPLEGREAVVLFNKGTKKTAEKTIEYFI